MDETRNETLLSCERRVHGWLTDCALHALQAVEAFVADSSLHDVLLAHQQYVMGLAGFDQVWRARAKVHADDIADALMGPAAEGPSRARDAVWHAYDSVMALGGPDDAAAVLTAAAYTVRDAAFATGAATGDATERRWQIVRAGYWLSETRPTFFYVLDA